MEEPPQFMLDTSGHCFLCLQKVDHPAKTKTDFGVRDDDDKRKRIFSFRDICQYLKMDLGKVFSSDSGSLTDELENSELKGSLCGECGQLSQLFSGYFLQLQEVQKKMGGCLKSICDRMMMTTDAAGENNGRVLEEFKKEMRRKPYTLFQLGIVERLRKTTLEKCDQLFEEAPPSPPPPLTTETEKGTASLLLPLSEEIKEEVLEPDPLALACPEPAIPAPTSVPGTFASTKPLSIFTDAEAMASSHINLKSRYIFKCGTCPRRFTSYRVKLDHQRTCHRQHNPSPTCLDQEEQQLANNGKGKLPLGGSRVVSVSSRIGNLTATANLETEDKEYEYEEEDSPSNDEFILPDNHPESYMIADAQIQTESSSSKTKSADGGGDDDDGPAERLKCKFCSKSFSNPSHTRRHERVACPLRTGSRGHSDTSSISPCPDGRFQCLGCKRFFGERRAVVYHQKGNYCRGPDYKPACLSRPHGCGECEKRFASHSQLLRHVSTVHARLWKFPCEVCGQRFNLKTQLAQHRNWLHPQKKTSKK